jgi:hypothetical protein
VSPRPSARLLACAALTAATVAGCGGDDGGGDVDVGPAAAVPADTPIYLEATVQPEGAAKTDADAALGKILDTNDPGAKLRSLVEKSAQDELKPGETFSFSEDFDTWVGERVGVFFPTFEEDEDGTFVIESTDDEAALNSLREDAGVTGKSGDYEGHTFEVDKNDGTVFGAVGDFIVSGSEEGFKQVVDASEGDSLGDSDEFKDSIDDLSEESLGLLYAVPGNFIDAIPPDEVDPATRSLLERAIGESGDEPVTGDVTASAEEIELEISTGGEGAETAQSALIEAAPAAAWLAFGIGDLGDTAKQVVDQLREADTPGLDQALSQVESTTGASLDELTAALGDAVLYVQGITEPTLTGALVIQSDDTELTGRLLTQVQGLLQLGGGGFKELSLPGGGTGFQINDAGLAPQPVELVQQDDKLVIGYGSGSAQEALTPAQPLSSSSVFGAAEEKVSALGMDLFLSLAPVFQLAESEGATKDPDYRQAKPYIDSLDYVAVGSGSENDRASARFIIGLK